MDICCGVHSSDQRDYTTEGEKLKLMDAAAQPIIQVLCSSQYEHASNR